MRSRTLRCAAFVTAVAALVVCPIGAQEQTRGATIGGVVRDSAARPIADADVSLRPGDRQTRTDSTGRFTFTDLDPDNYDVRARKVGFAPAGWDVKLNKSSRVDITIVLDRQSPVLDTMRVRASRECGPRSFEGFLCRRGRPGGVFLDDDDIDRKDVIYAAEVLRDVRGFHVDFRMTATGPVYFVEPQRRWECITSLVNGKPATAGNRVPEFASNLIAIEVYLRADSLPREFERYSLPATGVTRSGRCSVIVYWTDVPSKMKRPSPLRSARDSDREIDG